jgi:hypothetical protein
MTSVLRPSYSLRTRPCYRLPGFQEETINAYFSGSQGVVELQLCLSFNQILDTFNLSEIHLASEESTLRELSSFCKSTIRQFSKGLQNGRDDGSARMDMKLQDIF